MRTFFCSPFVNRANEQYSSYTEDGDCAIGPEVAVETILIEKKGEMAPFSVKLRGHANPSPRSAITESEQAKGQFRDVSNSFPLLSSQWSKAEQPFVTATYVIQEEQKSRQEIPTRPNLLTPYSRTHVTSDIAQAWLGMESSSSSLTSVASLTTKSTLSSVDNNTRPSKALLPRKDEPQQRSRPRPEVLRRWHVGNCNFPDLTAVTNASHRDIKNPSESHSKTIFLDKNDPLSGAPEAIKSSWKKVTVVKTAHKARGKMSTTTPTAAPPAATKWRSAVDPKSGRTYFYHLETRETQWRKPMELATKEERTIMEEKERRQREFFSQMESNILTSMSQGVLPGGASPSQKSKSRELSSSTTKSTLAAPPRSPKNLRSALKQLPRPQMVRTISSMDEDVLKDLVKKVPSTRNLMGKKSKKNNSTSTTSKEGRALDALDESNPNDFDCNADLLSSLPSDALSTVVEDDMNSSSFFHESSSSFSSNGFLSWEETRALQKLAQVTHEMSLMPEENSLRGLEETFEDEDIDNNNRSFNDQQLKVEIQWNGPPMEETSDLSNDSPSPHEVSPPTVLQPPKPETKESPGTSKPELKRRNTCGTLYVGTTMSAPDKDATIRVVCGVFRAHIMQSEKDEIAGPLGPEVDQYLIFFDQESQQQPRRQSIGFQRRRSLEHKNSLSERPEPPELEDICYFYRDIFRRAQMESDCIIMSLIYVERLIKTSEGALRPRTSNWRSLLFSCMILASKVWDDLSMWNADFSQACPPGVQFSLKRINELELAVLTALKFIVKVPASEYAKYYFVLRSMLIKSGLGGGDILSNTPLDVEGARRLQQVTAQFQVTAATKARMVHERSLRCKSMGEAEKKKMMQGAKRAMDMKNKVCLEHMVKM